jgi:hypothetical protein
MYKYATAELWFSYQKNSLDFSFVSTVREVKIGTLTRAGDLYYAGG